MSKKHFIALAKIIAATVDPIERKRLAMSIGGVCAATNDAFKWGTWLAACGVED